MPVAGLERVRRRGLVQSDPDRRSAPPNDSRIAHFAGLIDMHRQTGRKPDVSRQSEAQSVPRPIAYPALTDEAIRSVEKFGRAQARRLTQAAALIPALAFKRVIFRRDGPIGDLAA